MQEEIANLVFPVINRGLHLKERLDKGDTPDLDAEQSILKGLLLTEAEARRWLDYSGDSAARIEADDALARDLETRGGEGFLGIRYALACWLDEFFILYSPWESKWNERKLEGELYGTNDRAWKFWQQAELALARPRSDALEVFYLCVLLGFRGELREQYNHLQTWVSSTKTRVAKIQSQEWKYPLEYEPPTFVPPHYGREQLQKMVLTGGVVLLFLIPIVAFFMVQRLGQ